VVYNGGVGRDYRFKVPSPLVGIWHGTYSWNCGYSGGMGGTDIVFDITQDSSTGVPTGTATYLGGVSNISYASIDGTHVVIWVDPSAFAVGNIFDGTLSGDTILGTTTHGDSPGGGSGCSAPSPPTGTFSVTKG